MSSHTPGPLLASVDAENCGGGRNITDTRGYTVGHTARVMDGGEEVVSEAEAAANAVLFAAAPDLLYALKELHCVVRGECPSLLDADSGGSDELAIQVEAAIAKAEGRQ